ncbi:MAG: 3'-5' exonuclease [Thiomicrospira sp.]|jgi:DNA polymerase-3 subunit epsilon|nr:3'-5' exonuclease [Thiomicrospira sp.]
MWRNIQQAWWQYRLKDPAYQFLFDSPPDDDLICFDCETTGLNPKQDSIISLSAVKVRASAVLTSQRLNLTIKPTAQMSAESIVVHRLRHVDVEQGLEPSEAMQQFLTFIGPRPLVGYFLEFDVAMVNRLIKPWLGIGLPNRQIEVSQLYYQQFFKPHAPHQSESLDLSFNAMLKRLDLPQLGQHDAFNDALMTAMIYLKLRRMRGG